VTAPAVALRGWRLWLAGARPRTLGVSVAPVVVGAAAAYGDVGRLVWWRAGTALVVALALQVGTNYANDYSDGVRGTDARRTGPVRITASGLAASSAVRNAAILAFAIAASAGLALAVAVDLRLLVLGAAAIGAGVLYTGGPRPYGYAGLGELAVLVFFGFAATAGSAYVQLERVPASAWWGSVAMGLLACAVLVANNVRDVESDRAAGKRTLAVRLGERRARRVFAVCLAGAFAAVVVIGVSHPWALLGIGALPLAARPVRLVLTCDDALSLVAALVATARLQLVVAGLVAAGLAVS
jgi:1,4-dihydroxy-2-naphthoate octaprenyltransferase